MEEKGETLGEIPTMPGSPLRTTIQSADRTERRKRGVEPSRAPETWCSQNNIKVQSLPRPSRSIATQDGIRRQRFSGQAQLPWAYLAFVPRELLRPLRWGIRMGHRID